MSENVLVEVAKAGDPASIADAGHKASVALFRSLMSEFKSVCPGSPGLSWAQIDLILDHMEKKVPKIIEQEREI